MSLGNILEVIQQAITAELLEGKCWEEPISVEIYQVELTTLWQYPVIVNMMSVGKISKMPVDTRVLCISQDDSLKLRHSS